MAVGETARLIASLELQDKFSKTTDRFGRQLGGLERQTSTLGRLGGQVNAGLASAATNLTRIGIIGGGLLGLGIARGISSLRELEEVNVATRTVIESTGGAAGVTAEQVRALAEEYEALNATMDDKVIQSAENVLLTFTRVTGEGFEPALEAALNINEALGGGPEGLQNTVIQVGRALNDPIRGLTSLRRIGVSFSRQQEEQIRNLVEQNDLFGAQQIILDELTTEFGGQFAAAGETATGKFAKLTDAIEDAQMALATAFLPVLEKVADKLTTLVADPQFLTDVENFGEGLADAFDELVQFAEKIPWETIGTSLTIAGAGAKVLLDAFTALPDWVQTAVITSWGLNKLTGGALGSIFGTLASGIIKGILNMNAGVVNINAAVVNGGGGGGPDGPGGWIGGVGRFLATAAGVVSGVAVLAAADAVTRPILEEHGPLANPEMEDVLDDFREGFPAAFEALHGDNKQILAGQKQFIAGQNSLGSQFKGSRATQTQLNTLVRAGNAATLNKTGQVVNRLYDLRNTTAAGLNNVTGAVKAKRLNVQVNVNSSVSVTDITRRLISARVKTGTIAEFG